MVHLGVVWLGVMWFHWCGVLRYVVVRCSVLWLCIILCLGVV